MASAFASLDAGRARDAVAQFSQLTEAEPHRASHWANLGNALRAAGDFDDALLTYARAAALGASSGAFLFNVGLLHQDRGDFDNALRLYSDAVALEPLDSEMRLQQASCLYELLRIDEAVAALDSWESFQGLDSERIASIALLYLNLGETAASRNAMRRLLADPAPTPAALLRVAQIMERNNRVDEARSGLAVLREDQRAGASGEELAQLEAQLAQRERRHDVAAESFRTLAARCREPHRRHLHLFPLAKSLDALGRYDEAFEALMAAHQAQLAHLRRTRPDTVNLDEPPMLITRHGCDPRDVACWDDAGAPDAADSPVFIVAFPRSGTTLLEQALDAHPLLVSMDEQPFLQKAIDDILAQDVAYPEGLAALSAGMRARTRDVYLAHVRRRVTLRPGQRLIDKNPLNLLRLPAIRRLFPASRIVLAIRHPCDVVLSCFMQHFRAPEFALLCRDLPTLAVGYRRAFDFWYAQVALLSPAVHELRYEKLVAEFEPQMRTLATFLQLPWDDAMLDAAGHARARGFISTPSYSQVIEPVHRRSVERWRHYAKHFDRALPQLAPYLERWSYGA